MNEPLKSWAKDGFSIEINTTKCGSLAYRVYDGDQEIFHNNDFYASKEAINYIASDLIIFELINLINQQTKKLDDYQLAYLPQKKRDWINSSRFQQFVSYTNRSFNEKTI